jgi:tetratricopeptide (TPR) repeat protein
LKPTGVRRVWLECIRGSPIELKSHRRRKHPRLKTPKGTWVGWKFVKQRTVSRVQDLGLGGLFLSTPKPPALNSTIDLIFELSTGQVRARAVVRYAKQGTGMGVEFIEMGKEDRARLEQFLKSQRIEDMETDVKSERSARNGWDRELFQEELQSLLDVARKGTYYQLLGVTTESPAAQIKKSYHAVARKFHPDHHMDRPEFMASMKELMGIATDAYKTLANEKSRASYDQQIAASGSFDLQRGKTQVEETVEVCFNRAMECLQAKNISGSITWLRKCVNTVPDNAKYRALLARSLATVPAYRNEAIENFQKAIEFDPWNTNAYLEFGEIYEKMGLPWRATPLYAKVLEIDPDHAKARERLAKLEPQKKTDKRKLSPVISRVFGGRA